MLISTQDLVKKSLNLYRDNFKLFFQLAILVSLPSLIVEILKKVLTTVLGGQSQESFIITLYGIFFIVLALIAAVIGVWFSIVKIRIVAARYENKDITSIESYIHSDKKLILPVIVATVLSGIAIIGGFILVIIPGIIFSIWFAFVMYAVALDNQEAVASLGFSKNLVKGRWWAVLWIILVPTSIFIVGTYLLVTPFQILLTVTNSMFVVFTVLILTYLINLLFAPFLVSAQVILYSSLKSTRVTDGILATPSTVPDEPPF